VAAPLPALAIAARPASAPAARWMNRCRRV
jgi:hypothetical protein